MPIIGISSILSILYEQTVQQINKAPPPSCLLGPSKKALAESTTAKASPKAKPVRKVSKSVPKKPAAKEEPTSVAAEVKSSDKATAADVLGPDSGAPEAAKAEDAPAANEE